MSKKRGDRAIVFKGQEFPAININTKNDIEKTTVRERYQVNNLIKINRYFAIASECENNKK